MLDADDQKEKCNMRGNNVVGVLFSNVHDDKIRELTERRTIASVPFGADIA